MTDTLGRKIKLRKDSVVIAACRSKSLSINNENVDITTDDSDGWRELFDEPGEKTVDVTLDGQGYNTTIADLGLNTSSQYALVLTFESAYTISGTFAIASYSENYGYKEAVGFSLSLQSTAAVTKAAV